DVDIVYLLSGPTAEEIKRTPGLRLAAAKPPGVVFLDLPEQWDPKSPWHDRRVRLAASYALDPHAINHAQTLGLSPPPPAPAARRSRPPRAPVREGMRSARVRSGAAQEAAGGGRLPERLRRGRPHAVSAVLLAGRGDRRLPASRRHQDEAADDGARCVPHRVA